MSRKTPRAVSLQHGISVSCNKPSRQSQRSECQASLSRVYVRWDPGGLLDKEEAILWGFFYLLRWARGSARYSLITDCGRQSICLGSEAPYHPWKPRSVSKPGNPLLRSSQALRVFSGWRKGMRCQVVQKSPQTYGYYFPMPSRLYGGNRFLIPTVVLSLWLCLWNADLPSGWNWGPQSRQQDLYEKES